MRRILIIEDDRAISMVLRAYLHKEEYMVEQAYSVEEGIAKFEEYKPALVLLDIMLEDGDGWTVLRHIRERSACPVIMLTALGDLDNKLEGLNNGADDYIVKPFIGEEVVARVNTVLRRSPLVMEQEDVRYFGSLRVDFKAHQVTIHGTALKFTPKDLALLLYLAKHPNQTLSREQLIEHVWGIDYEGSDRAVDLAVKRIRQTLQQWPAEEGEITTLRGLGYQIRVCDNR